MNLKNVECFLLDMDGTIYLGNELIPGAKEFLHRIKAEGKSYLFLTNNSSKDKEAYVRKLSNMGIEATLDDVFSSGDATIHYLKKHTDHKHLFLLGTPALEQSFRKAGFKVYNERNENVECVVLGFDTTLTYDKLWAACDYVRELPYIATHPDFNCPLEGGKFMPDIGAMIAFIKAATEKEPVVIGKPKTHMLDAILEIYGLDKTTVAMVGDRLYTDIKMGEDLGITSVLVLSGETSMEDYQASPIQADFIFDSVDEMKDQI
ncbi:HAD-IIA family hydrolase [Alkalibacter rhizosphaerae]|uniref:HAD-IIA family hydrolase n=1 Tax=Alkalibacter rhizosphaerae TaxID=2815577 RepID=UPI001FEE6F9F|nr:HAD-IIA family hydrolase [Alkalibacter rhizosphaerae]